MDIKIVEAYLKRVIKAADMMLATIEAGNGTPEQLVGNMQIAGKHYNIAKKLFVVAANEFNNQKTPQEIYEKEDQKYYDEMYGNV